THILHRRRGLSNPVVQKKSHALFDADSAGAHAAVLEYLGHALVRTLVLFPRANVFAHLNQLTRTLFFKLRTHPRDLTARGKHHREHSLARAPAHARVIKHAAARFDVDRVDVLFAHQLLRFVDSTLAFLHRDRNDVISHATQASHGFRLRALLRLNGFVCVSERATKKRSSGDTGGQAEKICAVSAH